MTRGERNNNPFDLRYDSKIPWMGLASPPQDADGYCVFVAYANTLNPAYWGLRAGFRDLYTKWSIDKLRTIEEIVARFAPKNENDTEAYIALVVAKTGWARNEPLDLSTPEALKRFGCAFLVEEGTAGFSDGQLDAAVTAALARR